MSVAQPREAYTWFTTELANLRAAFRWAADHADLDIAAPIATLAMLLGSGVESYEPIAWAEELIDPARAVDHPRLAALYVMASQCWMPGRIEEAVRYSEAGQMVVGSGRDEMPFGIEGWLGAAYLVIGQSGKWVEWCRAVIKRRPATYVHAQGVLVIALKMSGADQEARAASEELLAVAEHTDNPNLAAWALFAYGTAQRDAAPAAAYEALRRGLTIAQDSGSAMTKSSIASILSTVATTLGEPTDALEYVTMSIRYYYDSGNFSVLHSPLAILAAFFDRLGHYEPAPTISEFAATPSPVRPTPRSTPRPPTCARCSATRPTNRSPTTERR